MSLKDPEDEYDDLVPDKKKGKVGKAASKAKTFAIILIIGIVLGAIASHMYIEPLLNDMASSSCKSCLESKDLLSKENDCLYQQVPDAKAAAENCTRILADTNYTLPTDNTNPLIETIPKSDTPLPDANTPDANVPENAEKGF